MNDSIHTIRRARVVREPNVRQVGDKTLVTITVAENPIGAKAKERYKTMFIDGTFSGREGERAATVKVGDQVGFYGSLGIREYEGKNGKGVAYEIPFATGLIILSAQTGEAEDAPAPKAESAGGTKGKDPFDF